MKVLLLRPPYTVYRQGFEKRIGLPLGLLYIGGVLDRAGVPVRVFDSLLYHDDHEPGLLGASWKRLEDAVRDFHPDVVGITNQFSQQKQNAFEAARRIKSLHPGIKTIIGGPPASAQPEEYLRSGWFDLAVVGEGEDIILDILSLLRGERPADGIPGLAWLEAGELRQNRPIRIENLDKLPFPAYHLIDMERYFDLNIKGLGTRPADPFERPQRDISVITSRGCPFSCVFCSIHGSMGKRWRGHSPAYVRSHLEFLVSTYGIELFHIEDDNFTFHKQRLHDILEGIIRLAVEFDTPNGVRADTLDRETLALMKRARIKELRIAIESGSQRVLDEIIGKHLDLRKAVEVCRLAGEMKIPMSSFFVVGLPGETLPEIRRTLDLASHLMRAYGVFPHLNVANPLEGTPLYDLSRAKGYLIGDGESDPSLPYRGRIGTENFTAAELDRLFARFHRRVAALYLLRMAMQPGPTVRKIFNLLTQPKATIGLIKALLQLTK